MNEEIQKHFDEAVSQSSVAAKNYLKANGWDIVREMYRASAEQIQSTASFTMLTTLNWENIKPKLEDPEAFAKNFQTLRNDLTLLIELLKKVGEKHIDRRGEPKVEEMPLLLDISQLYSDIQGKYETAVQPLIFSMIETMQKAGVEYITMPDFKEE